MTSTSTNDTRRAFGARVRTLREHADITQKQMADLMKQHGVDLHQSTIAKIEGGTRPTAVHELPAIAAALGATITDLLDEPSDDPDILYEVAARRLVLAEMDFEAACARSLIALKSHDDARTELAKVAPEPTAPNRWLLELTVRGNGHRSIRFALLRYALETFNSDLAGPHTGEWFYRHGHLRATSTMTHDDGPRELPNGVTA